MNKKDENNILSKNKKLDLLIHKVKGFYAFGDEEYERFRDNNINYKDAGWGIWIPESQFKYYCQTEQKIIDEEI